VRRGVIAEDPLDEAFSLSRTPQGRFIAYGLLAPGGGLALARLTPQPAVRPINALIRPVVEPSIPLLRMPVSHCE